jgi:hypothetical protein
MKFFKKVLIISALSFASMSVFIFQGEAKGGGNKIQPLWEDGMCLVVKTPEGHVGNTENPKILKDHVYNCNGKYANMEFELNFTNFPIVVGTFTKYDPKTGTVTGTMTKMNNAFDIDPSRLSFAPDGMSALLITTTPDPDHDPNADPNTHPDIFVGTGEFEDLTTIESHSRNTFNWDQTGRPEPTGCRDCTFVVHR